MTWSSPGRLTRSVPRRQSWTSSSNTPRCDANSARPIGAFQAVQHLCVDMYETVELARSGVIHALWAADAGTVPNDIQPRCGPKRSPAGWPPSVILPSKSSAVLATPGRHDAHLYLKRLLSWSAFLGGPDRYLVQLGAQFAESVLH